MRAEATRRGLEERAGFVLAGGRSSRMGADKALLPCDGAPLVKHVAAQVRRAAGSATLIGGRERYRNLGLRVLDDLEPGLGPLGGIRTALRVTSAEWNLVVACDMPRIEAAPLAGLLEAALSAQLRCLAAAGPSGIPEPLCAVYHRSAAPVLEQALAEGVRKASVVLSRLEAHTWRWPDAAGLANLNTPEEWLQFSNGR